MATRSRRTVTGQQTLVDGPAPAAEPARRRQAPSSAVAARLLALDRKADDAVLFVASSERRADEIAGALGSLGDPDRDEVLVLPPWDCLPYDRAKPSRESMGRRMAVLATLTAPSSRRRLLVACPEALMQRTPPAKAVAAYFDLEVGARIDRGALEAFALRTGYVFDERIDEPGEIAMLGSVIDVFPPADPAPFRVSVSEDDMVGDIKRFDPVTQRTEADVPSVRLTPASELVLKQAADAEALPEAAEHRLPQHYRSLSSAFDYLGDARIFTDAALDARVARFADQIEEAYRTRISFDGGERPLAPDRLYLTPAEMNERLAEAAPLDVDGVQPAPSVASARSPAKALKAYIQARCDDGHAVVLTGLKHEHRIVSRILKRGGVEAPLQIERWSQAVEPPAPVLSLAADLDTGFDDPRAKVTVIAASDIAGGRISRRRETVADAFGETEIRVGDVVIHEDHGLGVLQALERIEADGVERDVLRLEYHGGATVLAPIEEFGRIWRYGSEPSAVTLDRLNTQGWQKRRAEVSAQIDVVAAAMVATARERETKAAPVISPPAPAYARFAAGFPFPESVDQAAAIEDVLSDLASGKPMNRLVCGDVGFGKTEVALRAAAAVALSGHQVLIAAPTTVLARQHFEVFRRRFEGTDIGVGHLSRAVDRAETTAVRAGLADGSIRVVVGTQALASENLTFSDLALAIIDEEHRFGAALKAQIAARAPHLLLLSATPIPRTLQGAMVGVQDVSVIASPPARRRPIRTFLAPFDPGSMRLALLREKARDGQSFVVAPRIEDLAPLAQQLCSLTPELKVVAAHGKLPADEIDQVMTGFAAGDGDVLLATNIVENGLDVPMANTMLIWRPDRFGLAQLHQLRGRVGRGRRQGFAYLLSDPETPMAANTQARLHTLEALDRLGSGFAISARDLDLRGGGDLVGDEQAGHIRLIGSALYQRVLARALRLARGEAAIDAAPPKLSLASTGHVPTDYVPDATIRVNLYARLAQMNAVEEIDALHDEIEDRFGPMPEATQELLAARRLSALAVAAGVSELVSGPKATAVSFYAARRSSLETGLFAETGRRWSNDRLIVDAAEGTPHDQAFLESLLAEIAAV
jgi:transcription-repair coupling factor (superfamily II helicase)